MLAPSVIQVSGAQIPRLAQMVAGRLLQAMIWAAMQTVGSRTSLSTAPRCVRCMRREVIRVCHPCLLLPIV